VTIVWTLGHNTGIDMAFLQYEFFCVAQAGGFKNIVRLILNH